MVQKLSRLSRNFLVWLETFQIGCKPSRLSGNFPDCQNCFPYCPETIQTVRKPFRLSGNFPDCPETFQTLQNFFQTDQKPSKLSENFQDCPEAFQTVQKLHRLMLCFDLILGPICIYAQKLSGRAKTFRLAMPTRQRAFSDSELSQGKNKGVNLGWNACGKVLLKLLLRPLSYYKIHLYNHKYT